jgi:deazaflavin-dependent oxidoreductase (nitroreductase family)
MSDRIKEASDSGWIAAHREKYLKDGAAGHLWDSSAVGGPGPLPTLLLFTVGAKSGQESIMPLLYGKVEGGYAIIASKGGDPKHPGWFHNLMKQPLCKVQVATEVFTARPRVVDGAEREAIWDRMAAMYPPFTAYQAKAGRQIPVLVLAPET